MHYVEELARFAAGIRDGAIPIPEAVRERARLIVLDTVGAIVGARSLPEVERLEGLLDDSGALGKALVAGTAGVSLELDEGCAASRGHPGIHVVPVALQCAGGASGETVLRAVVAGYEVAARLGAATRFRPRTHPHGTWGGAGGATAAALLSGAGAAELAHAIRIAATLAIATEYAAVDEGATARNLWTGIGNVVALAAARAAKAGYTGPSDAPATVYGGVLGETFDPAVAAGGLGQRWYMTGNYFKLYACCRHAHAAIDAFRTLLEENAPGREDIETVTVETYARAAQAIGRTYEPETPLAAKFSLPYIYSVQLATGDLGRAAFEPPHLGAPLHRAFARKVTVAEDPAFTALLPATRAARVKMRLADGRELVAEAMGSRGDPHDPLDAADVEAKFMDLAVPALGEAAAAAIVHDAMALDTLEGTRGLAHAVLERPVPVPEKEIA